MEKKTLKELSIKEFTIVYTNIIKPKLLSQKHYLGDSLEKLK